MRVKKWNYRKQEYEPYDIPDDWNTPLSLEDMEKKVNCVSCGRLVRFGQTFCSYKFHNEIGLGYNVCPECHEKEFEEWMEDYKKRKKKGESNG